MNAITKYRIPVMLAVTAASMVVAWGVVSSTADLTGDLSGLAMASTGGGEGEGDEVVEFVASLLEAPGPLLDEGVVRDPLVPHRAPRPKTTARPKTTPKPAAPRYTVVAVIIDENPRAIMQTGGKNVVVKVGDELGGRKVVSIRDDGVTTDDGFKYAYP